KDKVFPGGVLLVSKNDSIVFFEAYGYANIFSKRLMTKNTIFDLASLTKPLATTLAVMKLIQQGKLDLEQNLGTVLPEFKDTDKKQITIKNLLCHNSGLPDYRPYYMELLKISYYFRKKALRAFLIKEPLLHPTGKNVLYSDPGFMILNWVVEKVSGIALDYFVNQNIYRPLGLEHLFFANLNSGRKRDFFAATELCPWRKILLNGLVHDDNAYVVGGIEGHAGLFGTAMDVKTLLFSLLSAFHEDSSKFIFNKDLIHKFFERQQGSDRALGFDTPSLIDSICGSYFSKRSVGHLGFTGTSFWMDLDRSIIVILLTNRVHPSRDNNKMKKFRPILHDTVMEVISSTFLMIDFLRIH
ncbi:MAG: serine hydrolase, partial [Desulfobacterales bacterium]|nr:serine hydrolase [Desulfobacterales bacterium]